MTVAVVRTVLGDVAASELGVIYAHEHLVIAGGLPVARHPDFLLADVARAAAELAPAKALGLCTVVDAMPCDAGRDAVMLAEIARRADVNVVAATGLHLERYYHDRHWSHLLPATDLAALFTADVTDGIDTYDYSGPVVRRTPHRAGVVKVAGDAGGPNLVQRRVFEAAAATHVATGCPILTHCERGHGALAQVALLTGAGVRPGGVVLSHTDKVVDRGYHREIFASGVFVAYDQSFRWGDDPNGTLRLLEWAFEDGHGDQVLLGMDAARRGYWRSYGGTPGLEFLLDGFTESMAARGITAPARHRLFVTNPARAYAFVPSAAG